MASTVIPQVLVAFCAIVALNFASTLPRDIAFPTAEENHAENLETIAYPSSVNNQPLQIPAQEDKPKSCFHFFVSRNMSSLLAEATKMLRTIRDRREREWVLTFIYRIKSLAEHLRAHPDSRNYDCLPTDDETKKRIVSGNVREQPELYFVDDVPKRSMEGEVVQEKTDDKNSNDNQESNNPSAEDQSKLSVTPKQEAITTSNDKSFTPSPSKLQTQSSAEILLVDSPSAGSDSEQGDLSLSKQDMPTTDQIQETVPLKEDRNVLSEKERTVDSSIVLSSAPDCESPTDCGKDQLSSASQVPRENYLTDAGNIYPAYDVREQDLSTAEFYQQEALKERIRKALLEELAPEVKKLRTVGGTEDDLVGLWNSNYVQEDKSMEENEVDFDYEETGAATGDLNLNEKVQPDRTVAPSLDEVQNSKENMNSAKDSSYEPYDDSDVLVQQLFDVRFNNPPSKTTKSLSDQNNEYLITSTHTPF